MRIIDDDVVLYCFILCENNIRKESSKKRWWDDIRGQRSQEEGEKLATADRRR